MTKKMKIASMQLKKIEKQLEFEMQINALLGTVDEEQIDEFGSRFCFLRYVYLLCFLILKQIIIFSNFI